MFNFLKKTMKIMQKERGILGVPLAKAKKLDDKIINNLFDIQKNFKNKFNSEGVQLQAAVRHYYTRAPLIKQIERDLVNMSEDIAVNEKVINQLNKLEQFTSATVEAMKRDWQETLDDVATWKKGRQLTREMNQVKSFMDMQITELRNLIARLEVSINTERLALKYTVDHPRISKGIRSKQEEETQLEKELAEAKKLLARIQAAKQANTFDSSIAANITSFWGEINESIQKTTFASISMVREENHKKEIEGIKENIALELASIMMALKYLDDEIKMFNQIGISLLKKSKTRKLERAIAALASEAA
jgi:hypothetical protein